MKEESKKLHKNMLLNTIDLFAKTYDEMMEDSKNEYLKKTYKDSYDFAMSMLKFAFNDSEYGHYAAIGLAFIAEYGMIPEENDKRKELFDKIIQEDPILESYLNIYNEVSIAFGASGVVLISEV